MKPLSLSIMTEIKDRPNTSVTCSLTVVAARNLIVSKARHITKNTFIVVEFAEQKWPLKGRPAADTMLIDETVYLQFQEGRKDTVLITVYQRGILAFDEFLGRLCLPLDDLCLAVEPAVNRWFPLKGKKDHQKYRGELSIRLEFYSATGHIRSSTSVDALSRLSESEMKTKDASKRSTGFSRIAAFGKRKLPKLRARKSAKNEMSGIISSRTLNASAPDVYRLYWAGEQNEKAVCSAEQSPPMDTLHKQLHSLTLDNRVSDSLRHTNTFAGPLSRVQERPQDECNNEEVQSSTESLLQEDDDFQQISSRAAADLKDLARSAVRISPPEHMPRRPAAIWSSTLTSDAVINLDLILDTLSREDLIDMIKEQRLKLSKQNRRLHELEDYIDSLLIRVMNTKPDILQSPS